MGLYERLLGSDPDNPKIPIHPFQSIMAEWARGRFTAQQARNAITAISGAPLTVGEETEVQTLVNTVPTGATVENKADRALRLFEIDQVLLIVDQNIAPYDNAAAIRTRLGV